jgi:phospholipase/carboxylesterase
VSPLPLDTFAHVHRPPTGDDRLTLLLLHGTGADEHNLLPLGEVLAPTARLLSPRGRVLEQGMPRWFRRHAEGVFDVEDLHARSHELADWLDTACQEYGADATRLIGAGFSNGANIAGALLLLRPRALRAAALFAPMLPLEPETLPDLGHAAVFVSAGRRDPICPPEQAERLASLLSDAGASVELRWHDGGHELAPDHAHAARDWLERWRAGSATDLGGVA